MSDSDIDFVEVQMGGGSPPDDMPVLTLTRLRTSIKPTDRDVGHISKSIYSSKNKKLDAHLNCFKTPKRLQPFQPLVRLMFSLKSKEPHESLSQVTWRLQVMHQKFSWRSVKPHARFTHILRLPTEPLGTVQNSKPIHPIHSVGLAPNYALTRLGFEPPQPLGESDAKSSDSSGSKHTSAMETSDEVIPLEKGKQGSLAHHSGGLVPAAALNKLGFEPA
ncbi:hypothetical protein SCLCIDRAFT_8208 [Scleroderma citrinum Foug A]|uniref:Uncharacterized protein n=1 Tax=Scleroderma citrinum Foug A TaxID=1036808 RepID=A0A0C3ECB6_9AGAM|nr:hypothetical protein SCLCIDRAFT_8208 [Scleroderma citrinum Foug A]